LKLNQLLVLAGGFGTRLKSVLNGTPKPLAEIGNEKFLFFFIKNWERQGINKFTFLLHYNAEMIIKYIRDNHQTKFSSKSQFEFIIEDKPLGTGGAVYNAILKNNIKDNFLLSNCDTWIGDCLNKFQSQPYPAIGLIYLDNRDRYGSVKIKDNFIVEFKEKDISNKKSYINAGIYYLNPSDFIYMERGCFSLETCFLPNLCRKQKVSPVFLKTDFIDIGVPSDYLKFIHWLENGKKGLL
jgi:D-glycero-alpha-D-manno-heptose 1-phosphate guanylyltransferase